MAVLDGVTLTVELPSDEELLLVAVLVLPLERELPLVVLETVVVVLRELPLDTDPDERELLLELLPVEPETVVELFLVLLPDVLVEAPVERLLLSSVERDTEDDCLDEDEPAEYAERDEDDELELEGLEYEDREDELEEVERELEEDVLALDDEDVDLEPDVCEEERELEDDERELLDCAEISSCDADNAIPISIIATANRFVFIAMMFFGSGCFNSIKVILF